MLYFDTSYLVRLYLDDSGFEAVRALAATEPIACSLHGRIECAAAIHRAYREARLNSSAYREILSQFEKDIAAEGFSWFPINDDLAQAAIQAYRTASPTLFLRAADALHLACARENGFKQIHSNDRHLLTAAPHFGLKGKNVIP